MKALIVAVCSLATTLPVSARIGENPKELQARYGAGKESPDHTTWYFCKNGIYITVTLWKGACHSITYASKASVHAGNFPKQEDSGKPEFSGFLTEGQAEALLIANAGNAKWKEAWPTSRRNTQDGKLVASWNPGQGLEITTSEWIEFMIQEQRKKEDSRIKGF